MSDINIAELLKGKSTLIKNKEFFPTKTYVEPFIERMSKFTDDFRISVKTPDQVTFNKEATDLTYNRVLIQAVMPEKYSIDHHSEVIGFLYGIDVKKPVVKIYRGYLNQACTNLCVFNPQWIEVQEMIPGDPINYNAVKMLMEQTSDFPVKLKALKDNYIDRNLRKQYLGEWVDYSLREGEDYGFGKVKIAVSTPVNAYKELFINSESDYYVPEGIDPSMFDIYNAFTHIDRGWHPDYFDKFNICLQSNEKSAFVYDDNRLIQKKGDIHFFRNDVNHSVINEGECDHIVMIVCLRIDRGYRCPWSPENWTIDKQLGE